MSSLLLPELPVIDVSDVTEAGSVLMEDIDYVVGEHGILYRVPPSAWPRGRANVSVTYSHGWTEIGDAQGAQVPMDIREAALSYAKDIYQAGTTPPAGISSETLGPYSYTRDAAQAALQAAGGSLEGLKAKLAHRRTPRLG